MEFEGISPTHCSQCPAHSGMVRRNMEVRLVESRNFKVELSASGPVASLQLSSYVCRDCGLCMTHPFHGEVEDEDNGNRCPCAVYVRGEDLQRAKDKARTAASQTATPKPKAGSLVACGQPSDDDEMDSPMERHLVPLRRVTGTVKLAEPRGSASHFASTSDRTKQDYSDLCKQVDDMKLQTERERSKNHRDEHCATIHSCIWGLPGSRAPDCHLGTARRTKNLHTAGILPQEQIRVKGFSGTPFRLP